MLKLLVIPILFFLTFFQTSRKFYILSDLAGDPAIGRQRRMLLGDSAGLADRKLEIIMVTPAENAALYKSLAGKSRGFQTVLVGLDGTRAWSSKSYVTLPVLFSIIDAMPQRAHETVH